MEWLNRLNAVITYLEEHLEDEIDLTRMAQISCCSPFHFQRMFSYLAEVPLGEYIRRRKMTRAAADLQNESERIIDIALKYGYDSPTSFNRAFQGVHEIAPSEARKSGAVLKAYLPISFKITIKGEAEMNYRIEKKDAFRMVGAKRALCSERGGKLHTDSSILAKNSAERHIYADFGTFESGAERDLGRNQ